MTKLRRPTLVAAPLFVVGLIGAALAIALGIWATWHLDELGSPFWIPFGIAVAIGVGAFAAVQGCFVQIRSDEVVDVVAWFRLQRIPRTRIESIRVRAGIWRFYELTMDDGSMRVLLGATPAQFPARLLPDARERDMADIELLLGE